MRQAPARQRKADYDPFEISEFGLDWGDISLIRERLAMTPHERLMANQRAVQAIIKLRHGS